MGAGTSGEASKIPAQDVQKFCSNLSKISQGARLYEAGNQLLVRMWANLETSWQVIAKRGEDLHLTIREQTLELDGTTVFEQPGRDNLASKLYRDGVRTLTLSPATRIEDLQALLTIFDTQKWSQDEDLADRLWTLALERIRFSAVDAYKQLADTSEGETTVNAAQTLAAWLEDGASAETTQAIGGRLVETLSTPLSLDFPQALNQALSGAGSALVTLFERVEDKSLALDPNALVLLSRLAIKTADNGILSAFEALLRDSDAKACFEQGPFELDIDDLVRAIGTAKSDEQAQARAFMARYYSPHPAGVVFDALVADLGVAKAFPALIVLEDSVPTALKTHVESLEPGDLVTVFSLYAQTWTDEAAELAQQILAEGTPESQAKLCGILPSDGLASLKDSILKVLDSDVPETCAAAADALRRLNDRSAGIFVLNRIRHLQVGEMPDATVRALLFALLTLGGDRYLDYLKEALGPIATGEGGFFGRKRAIQKHTHALARTAICEALARHSSANAWAILKSVSSYGDNDVKQELRQLRQQYEGKSRAFPKWKAPTWEVVERQVPIHPAHHVHFVGQVVTEESEYEAGSTLGADDIFDTYSLDPGLLDNEEQAAVVESPALEAAGADVYAMDAGLLSDSAGNEYAASAGASQSAELDVPAAQLRLEPSAEATNLFDDYGSVDLQGASVELDHGPVDPVEPEPELGVPPAQVRLQPTVEPTNLFDEYGSVDLASADESVHGADSSGFADESDDYVVPPDRPPAQYRLNQPVGPTDAFDDFYDVVDIGTEQEQGTDHDFGGFHEVDPEALSAGLDPTEVAPGFNDGGVVEGFDDRMLNEDPGYGYGELDLDELDDDEVTELGDYEVDDAPGAATRKPNRRRRRKTRIGREKADASTDRVDLATKRPVPEPTGDGGGEASTLARINVVSRKKAEESARPSSTRSGRKAEESARPSSTRSGRKAEESARPSTTRSGRKAEESARSTSGPGHTRSRRSEQAERSHSGGSATRSGRKAHAAKSASRSAEAAVVIQSSSVSTDDAASKTPSRKRAEAATRSSEYRGGIVKKRKAAKSASSRSADILRMPKKKVSQGSSASGSSDQLDQVREIDADVEELMKMFIAASDIVDSKEIEGGDEDPAINALLRDFVEVSKTRLKAKGEKRPQIDDLLHTLLEPGAQAKSSKRVVKAIVYASRDVIGKDEKLSRSKRQPSTPQLVQAFLRASQSAIEARNRGEEPAIEDLLKGFLDEE